MLGVKPRASAPRARGWSWLRSDEGYSTRVWRALGFDQLPRAWGLDEQRRRAPASGVWTADFVVLSALVALTLVFGRAFSKLKLPGGPIYATEIALVAMAATALWRVGWSGIFARIRRFVPQVALLVFWLAGVIALYRGLHGYGVRRTVPDVALFEYSVFIPVVAVVVDTRERVLRLLTVIAAAGFFSVVVLGIFGGIDGDNWLFERDPGVAIALSRTFVVLIVLTRLCLRLRVTVVEIALIGGALVLITLSGARASLLALVAALVLLVLLVPRGRRLLTSCVAVGAVAVSIGGTVLIEQTSPESPLIRSGVILPTGTTFFADDGASSFSGGEVVATDAATGTYSRLLARREQFVLPSLTALQPGSTYTVSFAVKPLSDQVTTGIVGDPNGLHWGQRYWTTRPSSEWQLFRRTLTATAGTETLSLVALRGSPRVLFDDIKVSEGRAADRSGIVAARSGRSSPDAGPSAQGPEGASNFLDDASSSFKGGTTVTGDAARGRYARRVRRGQRFELSALSGLRPGTAYTVSFAVKPLSPERTRGIVGDPGSGGWRKVRWTAAPVKRWQFFRRKLIATSATEDLALMALTGSPQVLFDAVEVTPEGPAARRRRTAPHAGPTANPNYVAGDKSAAFIGGALVVDAARGEFARRVGVGQPLKLMALGGLTPGMTYTIVFAVKPLQAQMTSGIVGDPTGLRWGQREWIAAPARKWQFFRKTLKATAPTEDLALVGVSGSPQLLFDAIKVIQGKVPGPQGDFPVPTADPSFVAGDKSSAFAGGTIVAGDAARGRYARRVELGEPLELSPLNGLVPGQRYTVLFAVKPLQAQVTSGILGDLTGLRWGQRGWTAAPARRWQFFRKTLTATADTKDLALVASSGSRQVLFDAIKVIRGRVPGPSGDFVVPPADPNFVADDRSSVFAGGTQVAGDAASGKLARRLGLGQPLELAGLRGLEPGTTYTVIFAVKPLEAQVTSGIVGDPTGLRWGQSEWTAAPVRRWQLFRKKLEATATSEDLALLASTGSRRVLFDAIKVIRGDVPGPEGDFVVPPANPNFVADDRSSAFAGGATVAGDAARGRYGRRLELGERFELSGLRGLTPGTTYTVIFAVKPLEAQVTTGLVGDPTGLRWGQRYWTTAPVRRWQFFRKKLEATAPSEDLALLVSTGSPRVLFDAIKVIRGDMPGPEGDFVPPRVNRKFIADDRSSVFSGGTIVAGDAATGRVARRLKRREPLEVLAFGGLRPGARYTVVFAVKPLEPRTTKGFVGSPARAGWGRRYWTTAPVAEWQFFRRTLTATAALEDLALVANSGSRSVLFDAVQVVRAKPSRVAAAAARSAAGFVRLASAKLPRGVTTLADPAPPPPPPPPPAQVPGYHYRLTTDLDNTFGGVSGSGTNSQWRLAIWHYMLKQTVHHPVLGVGFGRPTAFFWHGNVYDARAGNAADQQDVTGPHNSFVNLLFRMGLLGFLALLALVAFGAFRVLRALRSKQLVPLDRALLIATAASFIAVVVTASFSVALEGPYMGIFFWIFLGLLLVYPRVLPGAAARR